MTPLSTPQRRRRYGQFGVIALIIIAITPAAAEYRVQSVVPDEEHPDRTAFGQLTWRGGLSISATDARFGGLSALHVSADGSRMTALTDRGDWVTASLFYRDGNLSDMGAFRLAPLLDPRGEPVSGRSADSESLAQTDAGFVVAFERRHRLWRYSHAIDPTRARAKPLPPPPGLHALPGNGGIEALTRLCDGRLLAVAEKSATSGNSVAGWVQSGAAWKAFAYRTTAGLRPTGAATLPDCDIVFVERSFSIIAGLEIRIVRAPRNAIRPGAALRPDVLAALSGPLTIDNFEGIAARRNAAGETLIYLVSDDNFSAVQRTLLVMFALDRGP